jgi:hypothetical protein
LVEKKIKGFKVTDYNLSSHTFKHVISQVIWNHMFEMCSLNNDVVWNMASTLSLTW